MDAYVTTTRSDCPPELEGMSRMFASLPFIPASDPIMQRQHDSFASELPAARPPGNLRDDLLSSAHALDELGYSILGRKSIHHDAAVKTPASEQYEVWHELQPNTLRNLDSGKVVWGTTTPRVLRHHHPSNAKD